MSSYVCKYEIWYDNNGGFTDSEDIYCKYEGVSDCQLWVDEDGTPVNFNWKTDSHTKVIAMCILGIPIKDKYRVKIEGWEEIKEFDLPQAVASAFNYVYPQHINNDY
jgi:hypothetical protein